MADNMTVPANDQAEQEEFSKSSKAGWAWFTRFLLINVIVIAVALFFIATLTVWS